MAVRMWPPRHSDFGDPPARQSRSLPDLHDAARAPSLWPASDPAPIHRPFIPYPQPNHHQYPQYTSHSYGGTPPPKQALPARLKSLTADGSVSNKRPANYKAKYSHEMVLMILAFYNDIKADGTERGQREAYMQAIQRPAYKGMAKVTFESLLDNGSVTFKSLLRRIFPYANKQDLESMLQLAEMMPKPEPVEKRPEEDRHMDAIMMRFGVDARANGGFTLTLTELFDAISESSMTKNDLRNVMKNFDADGNGLVRVNING